MTTTVTVLTVLALAGRGLAHVALTFPQAKYPAYDFLDNTRTGSPCGVKDGADGASGETMAPGANDLFSLS